MRRMLMLSIIILAMPCFAGISKITEKTRKAILDTLQVDGSEIALITMKDGGKIHIKFFPEEAPNAVKNFIMLSNIGFYDGLTFHRVEKEPIPFVVQGGDPLGTGYGGPGYTTDAEFSDRPHLKGTLAMARGPDPNSAGSQFYICLDSLPNLDSSYTVFGQVIKGMGVVEKIKVGDVMKGVRIERMSYDMLEELLKEPSKNPLENTIYTPPTPKKAPKPVHPECEEGDEGFPVLRILVNKEGKVEDVRVVESVCPRLDGLAIEAVKNWEFTPAKILDRPINDWTTLPVEFTTTD